LLWALTAVNCVSVRAAGRFQLVTVLLKLVPLIVVIALAAIVVAHGRQTYSLPLRASDIHPGAINSAAALTLWAMLGVECASIASREVRDPARNVPRATLIGTVLAGSLYLLAATPITILLPAQAVAGSNAPFALFVAHYWDPRLALLVGLFAAISAIGALNGFILLQGELPLAMARNGAFPLWFARTWRGIPVRAQILSSGVATLLIAANASRSVSGLFRFMALLATAATLVLYLACALAALRLLQRRALPRSPALTVVAAAATVYGVWTLYGAGFEASGWGAVLLAAGIPVYLLMKRNRLNAPAVDLISPDVEA
jgi:APA family basic amino acid/polyamine antiporter